MQSISLSTGTFLSEHSRRSQSYYPSLSVQPCKDMKRPSAASTLKCSRLPITEEEPKSQEGASQAVLKGVEGNMHLIAAENMPGCMAMGRLNRSSTMVYDGGTIKCYGEYVSGSISDDHRQNLIRNSCPGAGACVGMYTANTMASAIEAMGMSLPYSPSTLAEDPLKLDECRLVGKYILESPKMDLKPLDHFQKIGRTPAVIRYLLEQGFVDGDCMTVTGKTLAENAELAPPLSKGQEIRRPIENPINKTAHIQILYGNLAPQDSVAKITGKEGIYFSGPALVFEGEEAMIAAISDDHSSFKEGGPIGLIQNGDIINIDIQKMRIGALVSDEEMEARRKKWTPPPFKANQGALYKYIKNVKPASSGCVTDEKKGHKADSMPC